MIRRAIRRRVAGPGSTRVVGSSTRCFCQLRTGAQWRLLPGDLPAWTAVWRQFCRWRDSGVWHLIMGRLLRRCRDEAGRDPQPSVALLDAQSVLSGRIGPREGVGTDGGKRIRGRKRHLLTDINGLPIAVSVTSAQPHDSRGGWALLETAKPQLTRLSKVFTRPHMSSWSHVPVKNSASRSTSGDVGSRPIVGAWRLTASRVRSR